MWPSVGTLVVQGGAAGVLVIAVLGILFGRIVPQKTVDQMRADLGVWRQTAEKALEANAELATQVGRLVGTTEQLIEAQRDTQALVRTLATSQPPVPR